MVLHSAVRVKKKRPSVKEGRSLVFEMLKNFSALLSYQRFPRRFE
jgi:hypothetical protein